MQRFLDKRALLLILILALMGPVRSLLTGGVSALSDWIVSTLIMIPGIIVGISFHEFAHASVAYRCGDPTPKLMGRCTVEPQAHIDPMGIICLLFIGFGWGKPVVVNPRNFGKERRDSIRVGLAGVAMNLLIAFLFGGLLKLLVTVAPGIYTSSFGHTVFMVFYYVIIINLSLMLFNLLPVPPLDGFGVITELFNLKNTQFYRFVYSNSLVILLALIILDVPSMLLSRPLSAIAGFITKTVFHIF